MQIERGLKNVFIQKKTRTKFLYTKQFFPALRNNQSPNTSRVWKIGALKESIWDNSTALITGPASAGVVTLSLRVSVSYIG